MSTPELQVSIATLNRALVIAIYVPLCVIAIRLLFPRLSTTCKRLAAVMLLGQILVLVLSLEIRTTSLLLEWLFRIDGEWNIPSVVAAAQLATVGSVALLSAWLLRKAPVQLPVYLLGLGLAFLVLGIDEFFDLRSSVRNIRTIYGAMGSILVLATVAIAFNSPQKLRTWHLCLFFGLGIVALGGLAFDSKPNICGTIGFISVKTGCFRTHHLEETLEFVGGWLALVAALGWFSGIEPVPNNRARRSLFAIPALWILVMALLSPVPSAPTYKLRNSIHSAAIEFESGEYLYGYEIDISSDELLLQLYSYPWRAEFYGLGYSVHLVDQASGGSLARSENVLKRSRIFQLFFGDFIKVYAQEAEVGFRREDDANRALWVVLKLWRERDGDYLPLKILSSDHRLLSDTQVVLEELVLPAPASPAADDPLASFNNGFALEAVDLPPTAAPGEVMSITFSWRSDADGDDNYAQFLHLGHSENGEWFVYDQRPLGDRLPTRLWYSGLADSETWYVPLPVDLAPGDYQVFTGLYRVSDGEREPVTDAVGNPWLDNRVALGNMIVKD